jgi:hypothetical protein
MPASQHGYPVTLDLVARRFDVKQLACVCIGDTGDAWMAEGWLHTAALMDLSSRNIVGQAMS